MSKGRQLAVHGGNPVIDFEFTDYRSIGKTDIDAAQAVLESGVLSRFIGASGESFLGGTSVKSMETAWGMYFHSDFAVSCNSWTSGLWLAIGALGIEPGSEVIVSSWTMAATATTILHWNLIPVFADIDQRSFNLDPVDVERRITSRTRAIVSPDIFGQSADIEALRNICKKYDLKLVSDTAQAPGAKRNGYFAGTASDIGGFSLNYHKHIHSGEGGVAVTNSPDLARRMQLLRNHGEVVVGQEQSAKSQYGILGMNMRMGEIEAAIAESQLKKLQRAIESRRRAANLFSKLISGLPGLTVPEVSQGNDHVYYIFGMQIDCERLGVTRESVSAALIAEGVPALMNGYQNIHKLPLFDNQATYKSNPLPYSMLPRRRQRELRRISLPISEKLHTQNFLGINWCSKEFNDSQVGLVAEAFEKVWDSLGSLRKVQ
jgi:perosamine synthetase